MPAKCNHPGAALSLEPVISTSVFPILLFPISVCPVSVLLILAINCQIGWALRGRNEERGERYGGLRWKWFRGKRKDGIAFYECCPRPLSICRDMITMVDIIDRAHPWIGSWHQLGVGGKDIFYCFDVSTEGRVWKLLNYDHHHDSWIHMWLQIWKLSSKLLWSPTILEIIS